jgi:mannitol-1-/sugar-/sorbitol-6-phosphatase
VADSPRSFSLRCAAILFDLDGVLVDSAACVDDTWRRWAVRHHLDPARVIEVAHGRRTIETVGLVAPHLSVEREVAELAESESTTTEGVFEVPGARELLERLPNGSWAVVTSGIRSVATLRIRHTRLPMPNVLVCADEIERGKPDPEGYLTAAERLGVSPGRCVVIEDAPAGIEAGRAAGMRVIGVTGTYPPERLGPADWTIPRLGVLEVDRVQGGPVLEISVSA